MCSRWANSACSSGVCALMPMSVGAVARELVPACRGRRSSAACSRARRGCRPSRRAAAGPARPCAGRRRRRARSRAASARSSSPPSVEGRATAGTSEPGRWSAAPSSTGTGRSAGRLLKSVLMSPFSLMVGRCPGAPRSSSSIVGGGSAGCVLAARLSEGGREVCLVEAGPDYGPYDGRALAAPTSSTRASSPSRTRGRPSARTAPSCARGSWAAARRTTRASSSRARRRTTTSGARDGAMRSSRPTSSAPSASCACARFADEELSPWHRAFAQAAGADAIVHPVNDVGAVRWNAAFAYLDPARGRENLTIRADTLVDRVLFSGDRAVGVATSAGELHADHVVLAAGRVRLAGDPAAQRRRRAARAADRRGADRSRRRRFRLRGHRPAAARGGGVRARPAALHGAGHDRGAQHARAARACATSSSSPRSTRLVPRATRAARPSSR